MRLARVVDPSHRTGRPPLRRDALGLGLAASAVAAAPGAARAQPVPRAADWPTRPVRHIEPFGPGSAPDIASRAWCAAMAEATGQQFVVENRVGAGGTVGATAIARAAPDGHTIGVGGIATLAIAPALHARLPYDPARDFTFVSGLWRGPNMLVVNNDLPARSVPELVELLRRNQGRHLYAHGGLGTSVHLAGELFKARAGVEMEGVSYPGPQAQLDIMSGRVPIAFLPFSTMIVGVREGRFRGLAVTGPERHPTAPDIPAVAEFLPGFDVSAWAIVAGPAGLAPALVERMHLLARRALETPALAERYQQMGIAPWPIGPAEIAAYRAEQAALLGPVVRASGARVE
jgi:tripartite-type tricarboxylate transporter receptor subunit TctC